MDLKRAKELGAELAGKLPWQEIADSPAIRYYTDWSKFEGFKPLGRPPAVSARPGPCEVVVQNGVFAGVGECEGVEVEAAGEVFNLAPIDSKILALHAAALEEAVKVRVKRTVPLLVVKLEALDEGHVASHVVLEIEGGGSVVVYASNGRGAMHTVVVEGWAKAPTEYVLVSKAEGPQYVHSVLHTASSVQARPLVVGGVMNAVREEYRIGEEAVAEAVGLELGLGEARIDHVVSLINDAPRGVGRAKLFAVAADKSFVTQRAVGRITKRGVMSDSSVEGVVFIAGEGAVANTQPIILVETGEVAGARHSAADASLDEEKEFLLRARGIRREDIPKLLIASFVDQYLASLTDTAAEYLRRAVLGEVATHLAPVSATPQYTAH